MGSLGPYQRKHKVAVVGSGNCQPNRPVHFSWPPSTHGVPRQSVGLAVVIWSNIVTLVGELQLPRSSLKMPRRIPTSLEEKVEMWVFEEKVEIGKDSPHYDANFSGPQNLTDVINRTHENVKYLPGVRLPTNLHANPSIEDAVKDGTILIKGKILPYARGISCIKGVDVNEEGISLFSETIGKTLGIYCGALSANIANEVAREKWSETSIAYDPPHMDSKAPTPQRSPILPSEAPSSAVRLPTDQPRRAQDPLPPPYFHVRVVNDVAGVSISGALKNVVAIAAGWVEGMGWGDNAKQPFFGATINQRTFTDESAGRGSDYQLQWWSHFRCAKLSVERKQPIEEIEQSETQRQKLQGTLTAVEVNNFLKKTRHGGRFPPLHLRYRMFCVIVRLSGVQPLANLLQHPQRSNEGR
ncbi:Glycerol-3-phosphate dehydrogenase [Penicillium oxalicum]|uniref:Glycerol-3-phosphate dehydrogenase n=1 Tax=Penicillium oxalicum TaxID=69781 RepID=UPI0020B880DE|nr:Glycerol-3-phosphate dehydrogenase [Penicillium oxalicum]KAI2793334.1 Glycerol-3-phosphate dehydrogenase [Penicillium oxalicum]